MKSYQQIPIIECNEPLLPISLEYFIVENPPPYQKLGADYQGRSPYFLRQGVNEALIKAHRRLSEIKPGWKLKIFDAYRPIQVQQFMVDYTFTSICQQRNLNPTELSARGRENIYREVYQFWAIPSNDPDTPPPHSTGAAIDLTLVDGGGNIVAMGGEIDEVSARSQPDYYATAGTPEGRRYHQRRELLNQIMVEAGFLRHPGEWWHFSQGDQLWAWLYNQKHHPSGMTAKYGRV